MINWDVARGQRVTRWFRNVRLLQRNAINIDVTISDLYRLTGQTDHPLDKGTVRLLGVRKQNYIASLGRMEKGQQAANLIKVDIRVGQFINEHTLSGMQIGLHTSVFYLIIANDNPQHEEDDQSEKDSLYNLANCDLHTHLVSQEYNYSSFIAVLPYSQWLSFPPLQSGRMKLIAEGG